MKKMNNSNSEKKYHTSDVLSILNTPIFKVMLGVAVLSAFTWGMFLEINRVLGYSHLGTFHYRNNVGLLTYSLTALISALLSGSVLYKGIRENHWSSGDMNVFYGGLLLALVLLLAGMEYLLFGEWEYTGVSLFFLIKNLVLVGLFLFLIRVWRMEKQQRRENQ